MVYYLSNLDIAERVPADWDAFWEQADFMLELVRCDLEKDLQSRDEAIGDAPRRQRDDVIRFRKTDDPDQIAYFHDLGRRTLQMVEELVERRTWTPGLAHHWSVLMFAHGFVMPSAFAVDNDMSRERGGVLVRAKLTREPYQRWFAHYCLRAFEACGDRFDADDEVERLIQWILAGKIEGLGGFPRQWFLPMVDTKKSDEPEKWKSEEDVPPLTSRFRQKHLSVKKMQWLILRPSNDIPPLSLPFPKP
jgi:hypothetical protein